jgi:hypothetical protein
MRKAAHEQLMLAADACRATLREHQEALGRIADVLLRHGRIAGTTVAEIIDAGSAREFMPR